MYRKYQPRRFSKRWNEGAPDYVLDVQDNKGKTADRYTVFFCKQFLFHVDKTGKIVEGSGEYHNTYVQYLHMSDAPTHPQGVSMWGELQAHHAANSRNGNDRIRWLDLPEHIRAHVIARATSEH